MDTAPASIDDYIAAQPSAVRPILQQIRAIVREEAPGATEAISYRIPAFMHGGALFYFAAFKKHIGIYPPVRGDTALLEALAPYRGMTGHALLMEVGADVLELPLAEQMRVVDELLAVGDRYEQEIAASREADARYR